MVAAQQLLAQFNLLSRAVPPQVNDLAQDE